MRQEFVPKLFTLVRRGIPGRQVVADILSGTGVGIVALPLAIAFAIASGVPPDKGIVTAIIAGLIISAFGGSRVQIGGPTGAFIVIVYGIVREHGVDGLTIATFIAGFLIIGMGLVRLGNWLRYIPHPLIVGFTAGIALIIFSSQMKDFFGLQMDHLPADFIDKWIAIAKNINHVNVYAIAIAVCTALISFNFHRITTRIPGSIIAILLSTFVVYLFRLPVDTIETRFGEIPNHFGMPQIPHVNFQVIKDLIQPAFAIALLGGIESLLSAVVADGMIGGRHRPNMELVAQGAANVFSSVFGGIPATGAIARTATNVKNGGRTPIAGIAHAIVLLLIMLFLAPYAKLIPMACLAGILVVVAYNMSEWRHFRQMLKGNRMDILVLLTTFILTLVFDLVIAIEIGMVLASFLFMKRMSESVSVQTITPDARPDEKEVLFDEEVLNLPKGVVLYEINGPLFFGASREFQDALSNIHLKPKVMILRMRNVPFIDATGMARLREVIHDFQNKRIQVILSGVKSEIREEFEKSGLYDLISRENVCADIHDAVTHARQLTLAGRP